MWYKLQIVKRALIDKTLTVRGKSLFCTAYNRHILVTDGGFKTYKLFWRIVWQTNIKQLKLIKINKNKNKQLSASQMTTFNWNYQPFADKDNFN